MIYYQIQIHQEILQVKRLSLTVPLFKILHNEGSMEIYWNKFSGHWCTLFRSNPNDIHQAPAMGPDIERFYSHITVPVYTSLTP